MDLKQIKDLKRKLGLSIQKDLCNFESITECQITKVEVTTTIETGPEGSLTVTNNVVDLTVEIV